MDTHDYDRITADQLTLARATDFARLTGLQAQFADLPDPGWYALRNFAPTFPKSLHADMLQKAAVAVGVSTDASWAGPLVVTQPLAEGFISLVRASSLIGLLNLRRVPLLGASLPVETTGATFGWVGENKPKVLSAGAFATLTLAWAKAAGIIAVSEELLQFAQPGNETSLRDVLVKGMQLFVDTEFTDQTVASTTARPGGLANGSPTAAASGTSSAAAATDIQAMVNAFVLVNPSLEDARFVMSPSVAIAVARAVNSTTLLATGGSLFGIPTVTTAAIGNKILLFDASQVVYGDDPAGVRIDVSRQALLMLDSAPSDPTIASDVFTSLWQKNLVAFKAEFPVRWRLARTDAARTLTGIAYV
jgi:HK97 family phage major capsid protein